MYLLPDGLSSRCPRRPSILFEVRDWAVITPALRLKMSSALGSTSSSGPTAIPPIDHRSNAGSSTLSSLCKSHPSCESLYVLAFPHINLCEIERLACYALSRRIIPVPVSTEPSFRNRSRCSSAHVGTTSHASHSVFALSRHGRFSGDSRAGPMLRKDLMQSVCSRKCVDRESPLARWRDFLHMDSVWCQSAAFLSRLIFGLYVRKWHLVLRKPHENLLYNPNAVISLFEPARGGLRVMDAVGGEAALLPSTPDCTVPSYDIAVGGGNGDA